MKIYAIVGSMSPHPGGIYADEKYADAVCAELNKNNRYYDYEVHEYELNMSTIFKP
jgi:hypothetical protein